MEPRIAGPASFPPFRWSGAPFGVRQGTTSGLRVGFAAHPDGSFEQLGCGIGSPVFAAGTPQPLVDAAVGQAIGRAVQLSRDMFEADRLESAEERANLLVETDERGVLHPPPA